MVTVWPMAKPLCSRATIAKTIVATAVGLVATVPVAIVVLVVVAALAVLVGSAVLRGAASLAFSGVLSPRFGFGQAEGLEKDPLFARSRVA